MPSSYTSYRCNQARRYMVLICHQWADDFLVSFTPDSALIDFGLSSCRIEVKDQSLDIELAARESMLNQLQMEMANNIRKFAPPGSEIRPKWLRTGPSFSSIADEPTIFK